MLKVFLGVCAIIVCLSSQAYAQVTVARTIIALYDKAEIEALGNSWTHRLAQMPLNHLGLKLEYHDINQPLPKIKDREDVRGVLSWYSVGTSLAKPLEYLQWAQEAAAKGKRFVVMGNPGFYENKAGKITPQKAINAFYNELGFSDTGQWTTLTYNVTIIHSDLEVTNFERAYAGLLPAFNGIMPIQKDAISYLITKRRGVEGSESHVVLATDKGGYVAQGYAHYYDPKGESNIRQWYINPFIFFKKAFGTDEVPKLDTTTLAGRRIFYSHIDGDGWNNITLLEKYRDQQAISAEVIYHEVLSRYTDLPVTVGVIAADIDKDWVGTDNARQIARDILALPHIEVGSHTYSHPLNWSFFEEGDIDEKERPYLGKYPYGSWAKPTTLNALFQPLEKFFKKEEYSSKQLLEDYMIPRAYANKPFSLEQEIKGAVDMIEALAPEGKKVKVIQWSGNTSPFQAAVSASRRQGVRNINGGDSRFDQEFLSYGYVSPLGRQVGNEFQVYTSNSNENTYTDLWSGRYYGFKYLVKTFENTEAPIRVKPLNIYYHIYSGERMASLNALFDNLNYAREQAIIPITASRFAAIIDGFRTASIQQMGNDHWRVLNRQALQTIRFDNAKGKRLDFTRSIGVIGQLYYQNSLYIYLDKAVEVPQIALIAKDDGQLQSYLFDSRWNVDTLRRGSRGFSFNTQGFGVGIMRWNMAHKGVYAVKIDRLDYTKITVDDSYILELNLGAEGLNMRNIEVEYLGDSDVR